MNQTVAVTGATGFIGKYIIDNLLAPRLSRSRIDAYCPRSRQ